MPPKRKLKSQTPSDEEPRAKSSLAKEVEELKRAIRKKDDWKEKLKNPVIVARYREEAVELSRVLLFRNRFRKGASAEAVDAALAEIDLFEIDEDRFDFDEIISNHCILHADNIVPEHLRQKLESDLDELANQPNPDYHPGSSNTVQDLIHPSLYPYIKYQTEVIGEELEVEETDRWERPSENSDYQWLPAIYSIDESNKVKITSYINNLDQNEFPEIYKDCEQVFEYLLPMIDKCVHYAQDSSFKDDPSTEYYKPDSPTPHSEKREYQVITKACNYVLKPGQTYEGNWHIEGMPHEHILVSALYYYSSSSFLEDNGLAFRADANYDNEYGPRGETNWNRSVNLGKIRTTQGRVIVFSNEFQHCVTLLKNLAKKETAYRKILCFFVVAPECPIVSSKQVLPQQWDKNRKKITVTMLWVLKKMGIVRFPKEVMIQIVEEAKVGLTWEEAKEHRQKLMDERKYFTNRMNEKMERSYSLCEH